MHEYKIGDRLLVRLLSGKIVDGFAPCGVTTTTIPH
jgi:hypothetical protein